MQSNTLDDLLLTPVVCRSVSSLLLSGIDGQVACPHTNSLPGDDAHDRVRLHLVLSSSVVVACIACMDQVRSGSFQLLEPPFSSVCKRFPGLLNDAVTAKNAGKRRFPNIQMLSNVQRYYGVLAATFTTCLIAG